MTIKESDLFGLPGKTPGIFYGKFPGIHSQGRRIDQFEGRIGTLGLIRAGIFLSLCSGCGGQKDRALVENIYTI